MITIQRTRKSWEDTISNMLLVHFKDAVVEEKNLPVEFIGCTVIIRDGKKWMIDRDDLASYRFEKYVDDPSIVKFYKINNYDKKHPKVFTYPYPAKYPYLLENIKLKEREYKNKIFIKANPSYGRYEIIKKLEGITNSDWDIKRSGKTNLGDFINEMRTYKFALNLYGSAKNAHRASEVMFAEVPMISPLIPEQGSVEPLLPNVHYILAKENNATSIIETYEEWKNKDASEIVINAKNYYNKYLSHKNWAKTIFEEVMA